MESKITPKQENNPSFDSNAVAVKHIEYYPYGGTYNEDKITPQLIQKILKEIPNGITDCPFSHDIHFLPQTASIFGVSKRTKKNGFIFPFSISDSCMPES